MPTALTQRAAFGNQILAGLPRERYSSLFSNLTRVSLNAHNILYYVEDDIRCAYFIDTGIASLMSISTEGNSSIEVGNVGREGMIGMPVLLRQAKTPYEVVMQLPGLISKVFAGLFFGVAPTDVLLLSLSFGLICVVSLVSVWVPLRRATSIDPLNALRTE